MASTAQIPASWTTSGAGVDKSSTTSQFMGPVITDIERLQAGTSITLSGLSAASSLAAANKLLLRTTTSTVYTTLAQVAAALPGLQGSWLTAGAIGLVGDGSTDDAPALQRALNTYAGTGTVFYLKSTHANNQFYLKGRVRLTSNVTVIFASPVKLAKAAGVDITGALAYVTGRDSFRLLSAASAGATTLSIDTAPHGGGNVSTLFSIGDQLEITGLLDSAGSAVTREIVYVTAVTDPGTLTISPALTNSYSVTYSAGDYEANWSAVNRTIIAKVAQARLSSGAAVGDNLVAINSADNSVLTAGDYVLVEDDKKASDVAGSSTSRLHIEPAKVVASFSGDASNTKRLDKRLEHAIETAYRGRLTKVNPVRGATLSAASFVFAESPDVSPSAITYPATITLALDSVMSDCTIPNTDAFGTRGCFVMDRSYGCVMRGMIVRNPRYVGSGEGHGVDMRHSSSCRVEGGVFDSTRHAVQFLGATNCTVQSIEVTNPKHTALDFRGSGEAGCTVLDAIVAAGLQFQDGEGRAPNAIAFGNDATLGGTRRCSVVGGRFTGFKGESTTHEAAIRFYPQSDRCFVRGAEFNDIGKLLVITDISGQGSLQATDCALYDVRVDGCADFLVDIDGRANGASTDAVDGFTLEGLTAQNIIKGFKVRRATNFRLIDGECTDVTPDATDKYAVVGDSCTKFFVSGNSFQGFARGVSLTTCGSDWRVLNNDFLDQTEGTVFLDGGGNSGGLWGDNNCHGFTPTQTYGGSAAMQNPRLSGAVTIADDAVFTIKPPRNTGLFYLNETDGSNDGVDVFARCVYWTTGTAGLQYSDNTSNMEFTTGDITSGGTDGKFVVSVYNGNIMIRNRLGSSYTIDLAFL